MLDYKSKGLSSNNLSEVDVNELNWNTRIFRCFKNSGSYLGPFTWEEMINTDKHFHYEDYEIKTVADLINHTPEDLLKIRCFGKKSLEMVKKELAKYDLTLKEDS